MGVFINPKDESKEAFLKREALEISRKEAFLKREALEISREEFLNLSFSDKMVSGLGRVGLCLVQNCGFSACAVIDNKDEAVLYTDDLGDLRPKRYFLIDSTKLEGIT